MTKKQTTPKWFEGVVYDNGTTVTNPFSGETYKLNALELSIYDFIVGANRVLEEAYHQDIDPNDKMRIIYGLLKCKYTARICTNTKGVFI